MHRLLLNIVSLTPSKRATSVILIVITGEKAIVDKIRTGVAARQPIALEIQFNCKRENRKP
jgi:hypothetical protein